MATPHRAPPTAPANAASVRPLAPPVPPFWSSINNAPAGSPIIAPMVNPRVAPLALLLKPILWTSAVEMPISLPDSGLRQKVESGETTAPRAMKERPSRNVSWTVRLPISLFICRICFPATRLDIRMSFVEAAHPESTANHRATQYRPKYPPAALRKNDITYLHRVR